MESLPYLLAFLSISFPWVSNAADQPNFLFLLSDDQAWTGLSCQMHPDMPNSKSPVIETPNIARLASEGMRFSSAYSPASVCAPTRISLQTGKSPAQCHWTKAAGSMTEADGFKLIPPQNRRSIEPDETTIGELLQSAGYTTAHFGKWHISGGGPEQHGYDESDGDTGNQDAEPYLPPNPVDIFGMGDRAMDLMTKSAQTKKPFFIQMSYHALHYPQNAPPELMEKYQKLIPGGNEKEIGRAAMSEALDQGVGRLLEKIEALGFADNTYVIYMSDNGSSTRQTLRGGKGGVWEGGIRVPLIVRGPGIAPNSWSQQRVVGYDFFPTFCELAGVEKDLPREIEGGSITHLFRGEDKPVTRPRKELVFHFPHYQGDTPHSALLLDDWKIMHFYETGETHLFNLKNDIQERNDLASKQPEITNRLKEKLFAYLAEIDARMPVKNPSYDPDNPPSMEKMRGGKNGGDGNQKGKGGGGKKKRGKGGGKKGGKPDSKDADTWSAEEYSGLRGKKELQAAMASKGFAWISGSPADNEKLSVGKNAQFFGFVALRYQSGRAANRGMLGRAMFAIAGEAQRKRMAEAVNAEKAALKEWWVVREEILTLLEDHLYTGLPIGREKLASLGERFSLLGSMVATHEAAAYAAFEDSMTSAQRDIMAGWRANAESAGEYGGDVRVEAEGVDREDQKQLEDLYAKAFSWITGKPEDNEIIPIGQPAQFFGFVSIRHKSGHAARRGTIAKDFFAMLNDEQQGVIEHAVEVQIPVVREFLENRHEFLNQLASLRTDPSAFDGERVHHLSAEMGRLEMEAAVIEAEAYRKIRASMDDDQVAALMKMRGEYVIDEAQVAAMDMEQRGATLAILCAGCHGAPGQHRAGLPAPSLDGFWDRKIASGPNFEYSAALTNVRRGGNEAWTPELLDQFLTNPKKFAPGTKMEFQGLLNEEDRMALIEHLKTSRQ